MRKASQTASDHVTELWSVNVDSASTLLSASGFASVLLLARAFAIHVLLLVAAVLLLKWTLALV